MNDNNENLTAHHDQKALQDRLESTRRELEAERENLERLKREANSQYDQDRTSINVLKDELGKHKTKLEETRYKKHFFK